MTELQSAALPGKPSSDEISHSPLSKVIHQWLREAILAGKLRPGQVLRQEELAARFKSSRVPLREALNHLEAEGLVTLRPRRGYAVTSLDSGELLEIFQLRVVIEEHAGYVATLTRTDRDVRAVEACLKAMDKIVAGELNATQRERWSALNRKFHETLVTSSGRKQLTRVVDNLRAKAEAYIRIELAMGQDLEEIQVDHRAIFAAFKAGDATTVGRLCRAHCERTALNFVRVLHAKGLAEDLPESMVLDLGPKRD